MSVWSNGPVLSVLVLTSDEQYAFMESADDRNLRFDLLSLGVGFSVLGGLGLIILLLLLLCRNLLIVLTLIRAFSCFL